MHHSVAIPINWASLIALLIPVLTAVITKCRAHTSAVHAVVAIVASALLTVVSMIITGAPVTVSQILATFLGVFVPAMAAYLGFWQPVTDINRKAAPDKGI